MTKIFLLCPYPVHLSQECYLNINMVIKYFKNVPLSIPSTLEHFSDFLSQQGPFCSFHCVCIIHTHTHTHTHTPPHILTAFQIRISCHSSNNLYFSCPNIVTPSVFISKNSSHSQTLHLNSQLYDFHSNEFSFH